MGAAITEIPGASEYFVGGAITYTRDTKVLAGVDPEILDAHGEVSSATAEAMAEAARIRFNADCGLSITGVAGPGDQDGMKAGTVFIGVSTPVGTMVKEHRFPSRRPLVRNRAVTASLLQLIRVLNSD